MELKNLCYSDSVFPVLLIFPFIISCRSGDNIFAYIHNPPPHKVQSKPHATM